MSEAVMVNSKIETKGILRSPSPGLGFSLIWTYTSFSCQDFLDEGAPLPLHLKKKMIGARNARR